MRPAEIGINRDKCQVLHLGKRNQMHSSYKIRNGEWLQPGAILKCAQPPRKKGGNKLGVT